MSGLMRKSERAQPFQIKNPEKKRMRVKKRYRMGGCIKRKLPLREDLN